MKTLKFRAWSESQKEWHYFTPENISTYKQTFEIHILNGDEFYLFTGLLDKNGKEIYEGDVLRSHSELFSNFGQYPTGKYATTIYQVLWVKDGWGHKTLASKTQVIGHESKGLSVMASLTEIIGNIYEHPELLKERV
jgi:uncharacterized phage protein (TIGR01671 family)